MSVTEMKSLRHIFGMLLGRYITSQSSVGARVRISPTAHLDETLKGRLISIGDEATISDYVQIVCHDASSNRRTGLTWVAPVTIEERAFVGAGSIILPGVTVGRDSVVAAGSVVASDVPPFSVVAGVPARRIGTVSEMDGRRITASVSYKCFDYRVCAKKGSRRMATQEMSAAISNQGGFFLVDRDRFVAPEKSYEGGD